MPRLFFSHYIYLIFCFVFFDLNIKKKNKKWKEKTVGIDFLPYISNTHQWERSFSME